MWNMKNFDSEAEKMAYQLKALAALVKDSSLILSTRVLWLITVRQLQNQGMWCPFLYSMDTHINVHT